MEENRYAPPYDDNIKEEIEKYKLISAKKAFSRTLLSASLYLIIPGALVYAVQIILLLTLGPEGTKSLTENIYYVWAMQVVAMYVTAFPLAYLVLKKLPRAKRTGSRMSLEEFITSFFIAEGVMIVGAIISNFIVALFSSLLGYEINNVTSDVIMASPIPIVILVAVIIGPIFEELMFRKLMIDRLSVYGDKFAVIVSAVSFGLFHGNLSQIIYAAGIGFVLGYVYVKTQNVTYSMFLHILLNFFGTVPALLSAKSQEKIAHILESLEVSAADILSNFKDYNIVLSATVIQYSFAIIGLVMLGYVIKVGLIKPRSECDVYIEKSKLTGAILKAPGTILFLLLCVAEVIMSMLPNTI